MDTIKLLNYCVSTHFVGNMGSVHSVQDKLSSYFYKQWGKWGDASTRAGFGDKHSKYGYARRSAHGLIR